MRMQPRFVIVNNPLFGRDFYTLCEATQDT
jgi:hypothetical protein